MWAKSMSLRMQVCWWCCEASDFDEWSLLHKVFRYATVTFLILLCSFCTYELTNHHIHTKTTIATEQGQIHDESEHQNNGWYLSVQYGLSWGYTFSMMAVILESVLCSVNESSVITVPSYICSYRNRNTAKNVCAINGVYSWHIGLNFKKLIGLPL